MTYTTLSEEDKSALRMQRLKALEADHFRHVLVLEEAADAAVKESLAIEMTDVERRIEIHRAALHLDSPHGTGND